MSLKTPINPFVAIFVILAFATGVGFLVYQMAQSDLPVTNPTDVPGEQVVCTQDVKE